MNNSRVFMIMPHHDDTSKALRYGEITLLYDESRRRYGPAIWDLEFTEIALERLDEAQYNPERDYLLMTGNLVPLVRFACAVVARYPTATALFYDKVTDGYKPLKLSTVGVRS